MEVLFFRCMKKDHDSRDQIYVPCTTCGDCKICSECILPEKGKYCQKGIFHNIFKKNRGFLIVFIKRWILVYFRSDTKRVDFSVKTVYYLKYRIG